jgi:hypothetical protein
MAAGINCINNSYGFTTLLQALLSQFAANTNIKGFNIHIITRTDTDEVITCSTHDTWEELFRQALVLEDSGELSLAVVISTSGFETLANCGINDSLDELLRMTFIKTETGQVALSLVQTNPD